jgi:hypothetical protein
MVQGLGGLWWPISGAAPPTPINDMALGPDGFLYLAGAFSAVGAGLSDEITRLFFDSDGTLYAGAKAYAAVRAWNGQLWRDVGSIATEGPVDFARSGDMLLIGGYFDVGTHSGLALLVGSTFFSLGILPAAYPETVAVAADGRIALGFDSALSCATASQTIFILQGTAAAWPVLTLAADTDPAAALFLREITNHTRAASLYFETAAVVRTRGSLVIDCESRTLIDMAGADQTRHVIPGSRFLSLVPGENRIGVLIEIAGGSGTIALHYRPRYWSLESADRP